MLVIAIPPNGPAEEIVLTIICLPDYSGFYLIQTKEIS